ncbi:hypothetical protein BaRGS_00001715 [Batillaria attramentaria]|uniref:Uncharacterized protein n=1 Tax=Batillaria attramentaria TaxID=370345 RepID=A0ABD0M4U8_9CAEN
MKPDMMPNTDNFTTWLPIANASDERCGMHLNVNETGTPLKAWLGMVGYIIIDVAFQFSIAFGKSWVVLCSPRPEHTSVLMLGTVMSSAGGLLTSVITTIDLQDICFCCSAKGMDLVVEVILQECIVFVLVLVGSVLTVVVGQRHLRRLINQKSDWSGVGKTSENTEPDAKGDPIAAADETDKERTPLIRDAEEPDQSASQISRAYLRNYRTNTPASSNLTASSNECMDSGNRTSPQVTICVLVQIFCMLSTDYVGKAIYGGNPEAEPGSDSLRNYQTGVKFASVGFIVYYSSYLLASVCQKRVHQLLGYRGEYTLIFLSVSVSMVTLALIPRIEIYFVMCILTGFQRASYYVVPFAATNDIVQAQAIRSGQDGAAQLGLFMSLVSGMDPLSFATIYPSILALEQSTGLVSFPLWTAAVSGCVSIVCFLLVGNI